MGAKTGAQGKKPSRNKRAEWQAISELLNHGQYEQAAQSLCSIHLPEPDNDPYLTHILATARQICLICEQVQAEIELHQKAYHEARQRERELQQQLTLILELMERHWKFDSLSIHNVAISAKNSYEDQESEVDNGRSWWQRLRTYFESKPSKVVVLGKEDVERETAVNPPPPTSPTIPVLTVYCLGTFRVYINETRIDNWNGNNAKSIFKYMVVNRNHPIPVEILMDLFWQTDEPDSARRNLYQAIYLLRQALQTPNHDYPYILSTNGCYGLNPDLTIWLDSEAFDQHYHNGRRFELSKENLKAVHEYEAADALYEGVFLSEDIYEEWPTTKRLEYQNAYLDILNRLSRYHYQQKNWAISIAYGQKLLQTDNCREDTHRRLMLAYCCQGQRHLALRQYQYCIEALLEELDANPAPETYELHQKIQQNHLQF